MAHSHFRTCAALHCFTCTPPPAADASRENKAKLGAWAALLRLLSLYAMGSPDVVDAELASDLVVITASAFEGAEARAEGRLSLCPRRINSLRHGAHRATKHRAFRQVSFPVYVHHACSSKLTLCLCRCVAANEGDGEEETTAWPDALVDVLLALLSKRTAPLPSAPLREAVEAAFRAMAESVTATGAPWLDLTHRYGMPRCMCQSPCHLRGL